MHYLKFVLLTLCIATVGYSAEEQNRALEFNLAEVVEQSDVIVVGQFMTKDRFDVSAPYLKHYSVDAKLTMKGDLPADAVIVVDTGVLSAEGSPAMIEEKFLYIMLLRKQDAEKTAQKFSIVGMWRGVISLSKEASEQRSVKGIRSKYDVDVVKQSDDFQAALRYLAAQKNSAAPLAPAAQAIFEKIKTYQ